MFVEKRPCLRPASRRLTAGCLAAAMAPLIPGAALSHHAMGSATPSTFVEGLISGLAHPVIGPDHLVFILVTGLAAGVLGLSAWLLALFVAASGAGVMVHVAELGLPLAEPLVALSLMAAGLGLLERSRVPSAAWWVLATVAGVLHGYAYGEAVVGAERTAVGAYLLGLAMVQFGLALAAARLGAWLAGGGHGATRVLAPAGAAALALGAAFLLLPLLPT